MYDYKYSIEIMKQELKNKLICPEVKYAFKASIEALEKQISKLAIEMQEKDLNEKTTIQIMLYDDRTGKHFYKHLTTIELTKIIGTWDKMQWI